MGKGRVRDFFFLRVCLYVVKVKEGGKRGCGDVDLSKKKIQFGWQVRGKDPVCARPILASYLRLLLGPVCLSTHSHMRAYWTSRPMWVTSTTPLRCR